MDFLQEISIDDLPTAQREIAELIGLEAYLKLVVTYGGMRPLYIPKFTEIKREIRNRELCKKFDGYNFQELAREYELTEVMVREIVRDITKEIRSRPPEGQESYFNQWKKRFLKI